MACLAAVALAVAMVLPAAAADGIGPRRAVERLFVASPLPEEWFTAAFLAEVPRREVEALITGLVERFGPLQSVTGEGDGLVVRLDRAEVPARVVLDAHGRIAGLWLDPPVAGDIADQVAAIAALPGATSVLVTTGGTTRAAHTADRVLAVGSAAKLAVLKAVADAVAAGRLAWDQVVPLDPAWRSLPTGMLQDWPEGTPLTLATIAALAISISDNTATDALIALAGRAAVDTVSPRNAPFLTTRELFTLKATDNAALSRRWRAADGAGRRRLLPEIARLPLPAAGGLVAEPTLDVEWFMTASELCALLDETAGLPALHINPGLARPEDWREIAYKGGSEPGVLSFATRLVGDDGAVHCVAAIWNDAAGLDDERLVAPYRAILHLLAAGD